MSDVQSDLVGSVVVVDHHALGYRDDGKTTRVLQGQIRAVTSNAEGRLILWVQELNEAESACWFSDERIAAKYRAQGPGHVHPVVISRAGKEGWVTFQVLEKPRS